MSQPRQCPGCKTWYAPHVEKCECATTQSTRDGDATMNESQPFWKPKIGKSNGATTMCKEGEHDAYIDGSGGMYCRKCRHFLFI